MANCLCAQTLNNKKLFSGGTFFHNVKKNFFSSFIKIWEIIKIFNGGSEFVGAGDADGK